MKDELGNERKDEIRDEKRDERKDERKENEKNNIRNFKNEMNKNNAENTDKEKIEKILRQLPESERRKIEKLLRKMEKSDESIGFYRDRDKVIVAINPENVDDPEILLRMDKVQELSITAGQILQIKEVIEAMIPYLLTMIESYSGIEMKEILIENSMKLYDYRAKMKGAVEKYMNEAVEVSNDNLWIYIATTVTELSAMYSGTLSYIAEKLSKIADNELRYIMEQMKNR